MNKTRKKKMKIYFGREKKFFFLTIISREKLFKKKKCSSEFPLNSLPSYSFTHLTYFLRVCVCLLPQCVITSEEYSHILFLEYFIIIVVIVLIIFSYNYYNPHQYISI